jgi:hypothetical protein
MGKESPTAGIPKQRASRVLRDMRAVYEQDPADDCSEAQRQLRVWFEEEPAKFMDRLSRMEEAHDRRKDGRRKEARAEVNGPQDDGESRALQNIDRLLGEWEKHKAEDYGRGNKLGSAGLEPSPRPG